jgi:hypothetical protein
MKPKVKETAATLRDKSVAKVKAKDFLCPTDLTCMYDDCMGYVASPFAATGNMIQLGFCATVSQGTRTTGD